ncbi:MAG: WbqC family protein, partial [bacterium]|nr:WbqC family protein [bacterium]
YLSGSAAKAYLDVERFKEAGIGLEYKTYDYPEYPQQYGTFEPQVTILDLLFNCGKDSRNYLKSLNQNEKVDL